MSETVGTPSFGNVKSINNQKIYQMRWNWKNIKFKIFPVEILFFIFIFLVMFHPQIYRQLFFQRYAQDVLSDFSNYTVPNTTVCLKQDIIVNYSSNATFEMIQRKANIFNMYNEVISLGCGSISALIYGPLSDIIGRKPIFLSVFIGLLLASLMQVAVVLFEINLYYNLISVAIYGIGGGYATMNGIVFAAVTDITPTKWRTMRMGAVESCVALGFIASFLAGYNWFQSDNCNFLPPSLLMVAMSSLGLLYLIVFPEPLHKTNTESHDSSSSNSVGIKKLTNGVKLFLVPNYSGYSNWWRVWFITLVICLTALCEVGSDEIMTYFLYNKPLEWSYRWIGYFGAFTNAIDAITLLVLLPILLTLGVSKYIILLLGVIIPSVCNAAIANVKKTWEMIIAGGFRSIRDIAFPVLRAMLADHVSPQDYGAALTISSSLETFSQSGSSVLFNELYHPQAVVNGHKVNAGIVFWVSAGIWASSIPFILFLWFFKHKKASSQPIQLVDEKGLLSSNSCDYGATNNKND